MQMRERPFDPDQRQTAGLAQRYAARAANHEACSDVSLEFADGLSDCRLRNVTRTSGSADAVAARSRLNGCEVTHIGNDQLHYAI